MNSSNEGKHDDEAALTEFLSSLMDYTPTIPDELVEHYLGRSGFQCPDLRLTRLVAVATQKFISEVACDSLQYCRARLSAPVKDKREASCSDNGRPFKSLERVWRELKASRVLRRQPFDWNGSIIKGGVM